MNQDGMAGAGETQPRARPAHRARGNAVKILVAVTATATLALAGITALTSGEESSATELAAQGGLLGDAASLTDVGGVTGGSGSGQSGTSGTSTGSAPQARAASAHEVMIMDFVYSPASLTVAVGDTVTWTNHDSAPHTVTVTDGPVKFDSGTLEQGESYSYTFTEAGTYSYYCAVHPNMVASVTVSGGATPTASPTVAPTATSSPAPPANSCGALDKSVDAFLQHFYAAHLERSLLGQIQDIVDIDQYVVMHTVLVKNMIEPQVTALLSGSEAALTIFLQHLYVAHLERSPGDQVKDITALDQYVQMHTAMVANMIKPFANTELGSC
jgi:plastocyanin